MKSNSNTDSNFLNNHLAKDSILKKDADFFRQDIKIEEAMMRQDIKIEYPKDYFRTDIKLKESSN